jgi:hypothetical protein
LVLVYGTEDIRAGKFDLRHPARPRDLSVDNCAQISNHGMSRLKLGWSWERRGLAVSLTSFEGNYRAPLELLRMSQRVLCLSWRAQNARVRVEID